MIRKVDISHKTILFITGFLALLWALLQIREVIIVLFVAIIFMSALAPLVDRLTKHKVPKALAIAFIYLLVIGLIGVLLSFVIRPLVEQTTYLAQNLPKTLGKLSILGPIDQNLVQDQVNNISKNAVTFTLAIFNNFIAFISVAVLTFYLLLERDRLDQLIEQFFIGNEVKARRITRQIEYKLGAWLRGQIALSLLIGSSVYVALFLLNIPYALPLSIIAGLMEVVPVIGPIISAIPAILIALTISPFLALIVAGTFFVVQQLESHVVIPQVMKKAIGLNPLVVILAVSIGGKLLGISGALLAVPITVVVQIISEGVLKDEKLLD